VADGSAGPARDGVKFAGCLIGESLRTGAALEHLLTVTKVARSESGEVDAGQPALWTFIEFEAAAEAADALAH
jgi:hypothetical protein